MSSNIIYEKDDVKLDRRDSCVLRVTFKGKEYSICDNDNTTERRDKSIIIPKGFSAIWENEGKLNGRKYIEVRKWEVELLENNTKKLNTIKKAIQLLKEGGLL